MLLFFLDQVLFYLNVISKTTQKSITKYIILKLLLNVVGGVSNVSK